MLEGAVPQAFFSREMLEKAVLTPEQEAIAETGHCPKCMESLTRNSEGGGLRFSQCCRCGDIWVTKA
jgi:hypothetical protein